LTIADDTPRRITFVLRPKEAGALSRMHHIRIALDHVWVPADLVPGSTDRRPLGLQIGPIDVR
jgi:hypothetical protein